MLQHTLVLWLMLGIQMKTPMPTLNVLVGWLVVSPNSSLRLVHCANVSPTFLCYFSVQSCFCGRLWITGRAHMGSPAELMVRMRASGTPASALKWVPG